MAERDRTTLVKDPHLPWDGPFPYDQLSKRLAEVGGHVVGPDSTAAEIKDSFFDLMGAGHASQADRVAWDALRRIEQRLVADFFMYEVEPADAEGVANEIAACPPPAWLPDFREIADVPPDFSTLTAPSQVDAGPLPEPLDIPPADTAVGALDLGALRIDLLRLLETEDE